MITTEKLSPFIECTPDPAGRLWRVKTGSCPHCGSLWPRIQRRLVRAKLGTAILAVFCCQHDAECYKLNHSLRSPSYPCRARGPAWGESFRGGYNMTDRLVPKWSACALGVALSLSFVTPLCQAAE